MVAIVIDLGYGRSERRNNQLAADLAALAGGEKLNDLSGSDPVGACKDAVLFFQANVPNSSVPQMTVDSQCSNLIATTCDNVNPSPNNATIPIGRFTVVVRYPIPSGEINDVRAGAQDGLPCERMSVQVKTTETTFFAGVVGVNSLATPASAVVRRSPPSQMRSPALWLLEPYGCIALDLNGTGTSVTVGTLSTPGLVVSDSDGSRSSTPNQCNGTSAVTLNASGGAQLRAVPTSGSDPGTIGLRALSIGATSCAGSTACLDSQIGATANIWPRPVAQPDRATRRPVDLRWNCKSTYPNYAPYGTSDSSSPAIAIAGCDGFAGTATTSGTAYVDNLMAAFTPSGQPPIDVAGPSSYKRWTDFFPSCDAPTTSVVGNWWVDCSSFKLTGGVTVEFNGNVVFDGDIKAPSGTLKINTSNPNATFAAVSGAASACPKRTVLSRPLVVMRDCLKYSSAQAAVVYMRNGTLDTSSNTILRNVAIIQNSGILKVSASSSSSVEITAPLDGPFNSLAYWSDYPSCGSDCSNYIVKGGASFTLRGTFFTPYAIPFTITGGAPTGQTAAQFISRTLKMNGGATLALVPDPDAVQTKAPPAAYLIR
jgi:hypothetical protein